MKRVFIDSSVLFSAAYSPRGQARDLILKAARVEVTLVISPLVLEETRRNLAEYAPETVDLFDLLVNIIPFEIVDPTRDDIIAAAEQIVLKDAPILAAARKAKVDLLVTFDRKHFIGKPELVAYLGSRIVTPLEAMEFLSTK